jgi:hypothetical protein
MVRDVATAPLDGPGEGAHFSDAVPSQRKTATATSGTDRP